MLLVLLVANRVSEPYFANGLSGGRSAALFSCYGGRTDGRIAIFMDSQDPPPAAPSTAPTAAAVTLTATAIITKTTTSTALDWVRLGGCLCWWGAVAIECCSLPSMGGGGSSGVYCKRGRGGCRGG